MIIDRVYRDYNDIVIVIQDLDNYEPAFALQDIPDSETLIRKIKSKIAEIKSDPLTPPDDPYTEKFEDLKTALEGLDIGD